MIDQAKNFMIGLFVIAAISIVIFILLFLHPSVGNEELVLRVRFADIDKISVGTRVTFAGKPIGEVVAINEVEETEKDRIGRDGKVYVYELILRADSSINVYNTDEIAAKTSGLLGEKSVVITPLPKKPGETLRVVSNDILYANEQGGVDDALKELRKIGNKIDTTLSAIEEAFNDLNKQHLFEKMAATAENLKSITSALNKPDEWSETLSNFHNLSAKMNKSWKTVDVSLKNILKATANAKTFTGDGVTIIGDMKEGRGTLGGLIRKDDLYLKLGALLSKANVTLNDIGHYGLLYHSDKGWQRLRARRMNMLYKLQNPAEFSNFFNDEIDGISTSLERVNMVLSDTESTLSPCCLGLNRDFTKVFRELLTRVKELEESLNMYNQQMQDESCRVEAELNCPCEG
ncbi:MAG TPA: MlaD family protein [Parachlamydiaceae bacterium]|nr:MlaD family protein [Parachlamydiaceae bacterium]